MLEDILESKEFTLSFEIFPTKSTSRKSLRIIYKTIALLEKFHPDFISVTFGAGGINLQNATELANFIKIMGSRALSHITAVGYTKEDVKKILNELYIADVRNILALRGDIPIDMKAKEVAWKDFKFAKDLIAFIKEDERFCIGAAVYPEGHPECRDINKNVDFLKEKIDAGATFFITQAFFDNQKFYRFMDVVEQRKLDYIKIIPGLMPVFDKKFLERILQMSKATIPDNLKEILDKYEGKDFEKAGMEFSIKQVKNLLDNLSAKSGLHLYTMNRVKFVSQIIKESKLKIKW